ncbi:hypothetical protein, partial [Klebsiella pneumoniae]|uniref:hypothetical protein n=1 Tax=Klebsiella pneumoniae TaxID=573 RepID=UPI003B987D5D
LAFAFHAKHTPRLASHRTPAFTLFIGACPHRCEASARSTTPIQIQLTEELRVMVGEAFRPSIPQRYE